MSYRYRSRQRAKRRRERDDEFLRWLIDQNFGLVYCPIGQREIYVEFTSGNDANSSPLRGRQVKGFVIYRCLRPHGGSVHWKHYETPLSLIAKKSKSLVDSYKLCLSRISNDLINVVRRSAVEAWITDHPPTH